MTVTPSHLLSHSCHAAHNNMTRPVPGRSGQGSTQTKLQFYSETHSIMQRYCKMSFHFPPKTCLNSPCYIVHCTCLGASVGLPMCPCQCISRSVIYGYYELATSTWSWSLHLARYHPAARWRVDMSERGQFTNAAPLPDTATHGPHQWSLGSPGRNKGEKWAAI